MRCTIVRREDDIEGHNSRVNHSDAILLLLLQLSEADFHIFIPLTERGAHRCNHDRTLNCRQGTDLKRGVVGFLHVMSTKDCSLVMRKNWNEMRRFHDLFFRFVGDPTSWCSGTLIFAHNYVWRTATYAHIPAAI